MTNAMTKTNYVENPQWRPTNSVIQFISEDGAGNHLKAANDNLQVHPSRWPLKDEYKNGWLGATEEANELNWQAANYIVEAWCNGRGERDEGWLASGTFQKGERGNLPGDLGKLRGQEIFVHSQQIWQIVDRDSGGCFWSIVKPATIDRCEMAYLAPLGTPKYKAAAAGRARLLSALPAVTETLFLMQLENAA